MRDWEACSMLLSVWHGCVCVWLQAAGFGDGEAFTDETFTGARSFQLEEMEVFAVSGFP